MKWTVNDITSLLGSAEIPSGQRSPKGISIDSRTIEEGMLFIAIKGEQFDGHNFVQAALDKGACAAVVTRNYKRDENLYLIQVPDTLKALQNLASAYRKTFAVPVIAITGTNGKTTTKEMLVSILKMFKKTAKSSGNFNNHIGLPLSLLSWPVDTEVGVLEMGMNHFGEIRFLCEIAQPTHGIITNIGRGHLEFLKNEAGVAKAKGELLGYLNGNGTAFLNGDDEWLLSMTDYVSDTVLFGFSEKCHFRAEAYRSENNRISFQVNEQKIQIPVHGKYNVYNALGAISAARRLFVSWEIIQQGLSDFQPVTQRMNFLKLGFISVLNDSYNANPDSVKQAMLTLGDISVKGRKIIVMGNMEELGDAGEKEHIRIGQLACELRFDGFWGYGSLMKKAVETARKSGMTHCYHFNNHQTLCESLLQFLQEGDTVLVKGSRSARMETVISILEKSMNTEGK